MSGQVLEKVRAIPGVESAAGTSRLRNMILREAMTLAIIGIALGLGAAYGLTRLMTTLLYSVTPRDPVIFVSVAALLGVVALAARYLPARRALRVDPLVALRYE